ncbi:MAG: ATP-binding protein [Anaerolineae bacterium]
MSEHNIQLHLPGILKLLSEHLYSNPHIAVREILQNAVDSIRRRQIESGWQGDPRIVIHLGERTLSVSDNGSGLTHDEIMDYLATLGRSYTGDMRARHQDQTLIGSFGLGILSGFIVADRLTLVTRSYQSDDVWQWQSAGDGRFSLEPAQRDSTGSTLTLHLMAEGEFLLNRSLLADLIRRYADFLPVPVFIGSDRINRLHAPSHQPSDVEAYRQYIVDQTGEVPLSVLPLRSDGVPLSGVVYVPAGGVLSINEFGDAAVYIRRMFITAEETGLLPRWAKFVRAVVESPALNPTASREQVRRDEAFYRVQRAIERQILVHFETLAAEQPAVWRSIVLEHNDLIKAWALESRAFFDAVCDIVTFETSRGRLTLPEYLDLADGVVYYFSDGGSATQEKMLYEASGLPVIDASRFAEEDFLMLYERIRPGVQVRQLEPGSDYLFHDPGETDAAWENIRRYFADQNIQTRLVSFEPAAIPAILVFPPGSDDVARARSALQSGEVTGPVAGFLEEYIRLRDPDQRTTRGTLHVNVNSALMRQLCALPPESEVFTAALEIIYQNARFFAGRMLTTHTARTAFDMITFSVQRLVESVMDGPR